MITETRPPKPPDYLAELITGGDEFCVYCGSLLKDPCMTPKPNCAKALIATYTTLLMEKYAIKSR